MAFALFFSFLAIAAGAKIAEGTSLHEDYLSRSSTASVNGIFVLFILLSHASSYLAMDRAGDELFVAWQSFVGQLTVGGEQ